jgi:cystathionine gamma-lyase
VKAGLPQPEQGEPFLPGPVFAAPFHLQGDPEQAPYSYTRYGNPTWTRFESALGELEDAEAILFPSGMAAAAALLMTLTKPGDAIAMDDSCYHGVRRLARSHLEPRGVDVRLAPPAGLAAAAGGTVLLWLETPSNPKLQVYDIAELSRAARDEGALTVVDNTTAGPLLQRPLDLGADVALTSATKQVSGHADLMLGYLTTRDPVRAQGLRDWRRDAGALPGPFEAWLGHRSLPTLALRVERGCDNALALARLLAGRDDVVSVAYPGLTGDPAHEIARRQMLGYGMVLSFDLGSEDRAEGFLGAAELVIDASSFGRSTRAQNGARAGAATTSRPASSACLPAVRRPPTCSRMWSARSTGLERRSGCACRRPLGSGPDGRMGLVDDRGGGSRGRRDRDDGLLPGPDRGGRRGRGGRGARRRGAGGAVDRVHRGVAGVPARPAPYRQAPPAFPGAAPYGHRRAGRPPGRRARAGRSGQRPGQARR